MNQNNDLAKILKFHYIINSPFGLSTTKYVDGKIIEISLFYRIYTYLVFIFLTIMYIYSNYISILKISGLYPKFVNFTIKSKIISLMLAFIVINIFNIFVIRKSTLKFYTKLVEIEKLLSHENKNTICIIYKAIFFYICYIIIRASLSVLSYFGFPHYNGAMYDLLSLIIDSETFRFCFEINYISSKFELLNQYLGDVGLNLQSKNIDFHINDGVLEALWRNFNEQKCNESIDKLLYIHNKLCELIEQMNYFYSTKVFLIIKKQ